MTSEIKVDTISEQTSANGVTIDGLTIKDGNIIGDVALAGTTPTFTVGDGGAEDAALIFDGNAQDFYVALDDSADDLVIGTGSTVGSNAKMVIENGGNVGIGETAPLGNLHVKSADSGASAHASADELVIEGSANSGINILSGNSAEGGIYFGDDGDNDIGRIRYDHSNNSLDFFTNAAERMSLASNGGVIITTGDNLDTLTLTSTDADGNPGPVLNYYRNSGSAADNDYIGRNIFTFNNDAPEIETALAQNIIMTDVSNGSEDVKYIQEQMTAGSIVERFTISASEAVFNEGSVDVDFRVESNGNTHKFMVNGGNNLVGINADPDLGSALHIKNADSGGSSNNDADELVLENSANTGISILSGTGSSGTISFGDSGGNNRGLVTYDHSSDSMKFGCNGAVQARITNGGTISLNDSAPDAPSNGLTMNTGSNDGNVLTMKSSDVAHGMTAIAETDTFVEMLKNSDGGGALNLTTLSETATAFRHIACITGSNTAESTAATSAWGVDARKKNGTSVEGLAADDNLASFRHSDEAQVIFKGDGEIFSNQTATVGTYDAYEDAQLIRAYDLSHMKGVIDSKFDKFVQYNKDDLQKARLIGTDDDGKATPFVNITGMSRLHNGAIWQQYEKHQRLASAFYKLAEKTIGKEEADKLLTEEEIQLLN